MTPSTVETLPALLQGMAAELKNLPLGWRQQAPVMIGIHTGGVWVAEQLHRLLALPEPLGKLNISFYRDDFSQTGLHPQVQPSALPFSVDNRSIILVDDVLYTGRTIRAALNELFDYGRPARVALAVLADRGGRELPIQPAVCGLRVSLQAGQQIKLSGPQPLVLKITGGA